MPSASEFLSAYQPPRSAADFLSAYDPELPGRVGTAVSNLGRSFASLPSALAKDVSVAAAGIEQNLLDVYSRIDQGASAEEAATDAQGRIDRLGGLYQAAKVYEGLSPEDRQRVRESAGPRDPRERTLYKAGTAADRAVESVTPVNPAFQDEFLASKLPQGLGSGLSFLTTGLVGRALRLPALLTTSVAGAGVGAASQFEDAINRGASLEEAEAAAGYGSALGLTEAVPITRLLDRLDKGTGGSVRRLLIETVKQGSEEAIQEFVQTVGENLVASKLVGYDPERGVFEGSGEASGTGFTVGALMEFVGGLVAGRRGRTTPLTQEDIDSPIDSNVLAEGKTILDAFDGSGVEPTPPASAPSTEQAWQTLFDEAGAEIGQFNPATGTVRRQPVPPTIPSTPAEETADVRQAQEAEEERPPAEVIPAERGTAAAERGVLTAAPAPPQARPRPPEAVAAEGRTFTPEEAIPLVRDQFRRMGEPAGVSDIEATRTAMVERGVDAETAVDEYIEAGAVRAAELVAEESRDGRYRNIPYESGPDQARGAAGAGIEGPARALAEPVRGQEARPAPAQAPRPQTVEDRAAERGVEPQFSIRRNEPPRPTDKSENIRRGREAIDTVLRDRSDEPFGVHRPEIGWIGFVWGDRSSGIEHAIYQRVNEDGLSTSQAIALMRELPDVLANGRLGAYYKTRNNEVGRNINWNGKTAALRFVRHGERGVWVVTAFEGMRGPPQGARLISVSEAERMIADAVKPGGRLRPGATQPDLQAVLRAPASEEASRPKASPGISDRAGPADRPPSREISGRLGAATEESVAAEAVPGKRAPQATEVIGEKERGPQGAPPSRGPIPRAGHPSRPLKERLSPQADVAKRPEDTEPQQRLTGASETGVSPDFADAATSEALQGLMERLRRFDPRGRLALRFKEKIEALIDGNLLQGQYLRGLIEISLTAKDKVFTLDHEVIHGLRELGLFTEAEWRALTIRARSVPGLMASVRERYAGMGLSQEKLLEEAVADLHGMWQRGDVEASGAQLSALQRITEFVRAVGDWLRGEGFTSVDQIFGKVSRGEVGAREVRTGEQSAEPLFSIAPSATAGVVRRDAGIFGTPARSTTALPMLASLRDNFSPQNIRDVIDRWRTGFQDRFLPLLRTQQAIEKAIGRPLAEGENPYLLEELSAGRKGAKLDDLAEEHIRPLFAEMHARNITVDELETYLYARHAPERNARIAQINPEFGPGEGSGMTDAEAADIMKAVERSGKKRSLEALAKRVDAIIAQALKERVDAGLLSQAEADQWRATYKHYVPLRGEGELDPDLEADRPRLAKGITVKGPESRRAFGRKSKASDILAYTVMQAQEAIMRAEINHVAKAFHDLAQAAPNPGFWTVNKITTRPVWNKAKGQVEYRPESRIAAEDADYTVSLKIDGVEHRVTLNRRNPDAVRLAEAMRNLKSEQVSAVIQYFGAINRFLSTVNTTLNYEFVITNAFRDIQTATINLNQFDVPGIVRGTLRDYPAALKAATKGAFGKFEGDWGKWYREFRDNGGRVYFNTVEDIKQQRKKLEREIKNAKPGLTAQKAVTSVFGFIQNLNNGVENAIRLSAYKNARQAGMTKLRAASLAKNLTINFNRRGSYGPLINSLYLFYNASIQGTTVMLTAMKSPKVQKVLGGAVAAGALLAALNAMTSAEDDDGELVYDKISEFDKSRNLIIMQPGGKEYWKIPLPYGYNIFFNVGRGMAELYRGKDWTKVAAAQLEAMVDAFNPIGGAQSILNIIAPTVIDPFVDIVLNRDFADRPIRPDQPQFGPPTPENQRYWGSVSPYSKAITDFLNEATGGDEIVPGKIDVSPEILDYMFGVATGAAGTSLRRIADLPLKIADPTSDLNWNDIPLVRRVVGSKGPWVDRSLFYERAAETEIFLDRYKDYLKSGQRAKADAYLARHGNEIKLARRAAKSREMLANIRKAQDGIKRQRDAGKITKSEYTDKFNDWNERAAGIIREFNAAYIDMVKQ